MFFHCGVRLTTVLRFGFLSFQRLSQLQRRALVTRVRVGPHYELRDGGGELTVDFIVGKINV